MTIPIVSTTIAVDRSVEADDAYDEPTSQRTASGVNAHIWVESGTRNTTAGGTTQVGMYRLVSDPIDLRPGDTVTDLSTNDTYSVEWSHRSSAYLPQTRAGLEKVTFE